MKTPFTPCAEGLLIAVRLTPRGGRDAIDGIETLSDGQTVIKARVRALPEDGAANAALIKLLAKICDRPASAVSVVSGVTSRVKMLKVAGDSSDLVFRLSTVIKP